MCACMCVHVCLCGDIARYGKVLWTRDRETGQGEDWVFFFSSRNSCVCISSYTSISVLRYAMLCYAAGCLPCAYTPLTKQKKALSVTMTGLQPERCMAAAPSNSARAHPYPSALSTLFNSCFMAPNSGHNDGRTPVCHGGVDRLGDTLACDTLVHHFLDSL